MQRLFDIKKTQIEMVSDRGYDISPEEVAILTMNINQFTNYVNNLATNVPRTTQRSLLSHSYTANLPGGGVRTMIVYYGGKKTPQQKQVSAEVVRSFIGVVQRYNINEAILIVDGPLSPKGNDELSALTLTKWQVFFDGELTYNPTRHVDSVKHTLLSKEETAAKLKELRVDLSKLLIINETDPIIRYYGWPVGQIVRVDRNDSFLNILSPHSINYRVIVAKRHT